ncbi:YncE family protein, partial [Streptomyces griseofuscus]
MSAQPTSAWRRLLRFRPLNRPRLTLLSGPTVTVGDFPIDVVISPDGTTAYVTNEGDDTVSVIDTATQTVTATIPVGTVPFWATITPDGS